MEVTAEDAQAHVALLGAHTKQFVTFFQEFASSSIVVDGEAESLPFGDKKYMNQLQEIKNCTRKILNVYLDDVRRYFLVDVDDKSLYNQFMTNTFRYLEIMYAAADNCLERIEKKANDDTDNLALNREDAEVIDTVEELREKRMKQSRLPVYLYSNFEIWLVPGEDSPISIKSVDADRVGALSLIEADVVRVGLLKPRVQVATYECDTCHSHTYKAVEGPNFMPLMDCTICLGTKNIRGTLKFHHKLSKFEKYQEVRIQEPLSHLFEGELPKAMRCDLFGEHTQTLKPGDSVLLFGILLPIVQTGYNLNPLALLAEKTFRVVYIKHQKKEREDINSLQLQQEIEALRNDPNCYERLAYSIAPEIYGHDDVKKALLIQLVGGCARDKSDGGHIRGNIHVLLLGDPGVAKSQLLKKVAMLSSRGVYTTGKGSSSTGMTAAIIKDPATGETALEGGALVLADTGICCIDEFDKMDDHDRCAIYEVMEQQTVSIAKAGHCSTMPARSAVLAAANPVNGQYDVRKSIFANMNLDAALLTRFDLKFLILDRAHRAKDGQLAEHVVDLVKGTDRVAKIFGEQKPAAPSRRFKESSRASPLNPNEIPSLTAPISKEVMRRYIAMAKQYEPVMPPELVEMAADWYVQARQYEKQQDDYNYDRYTFTTPRSLLAILRICQALARLRFSNEVDVNDFQEAVRLSECLGVCLKEALLERGIGKRGSNPTSQIMFILKRMRDGRKRVDQDFNGWIPIKDVEQQVLSMGLRRNDLTSALNKYSKLAVVVINPSNEALAFPQDVDEF